MKKCKVCGDNTEVVFNIEFKATPICESCATAIFLQQAKWYAETTQIEPVAFNGSNIPGHSNPPPPPPPPSRYLKEGDEPPKPKK